MVLDLIIPWLPEDLQRYTVYCSSLYSNHYCMFCICDLITYSASGLSAIVKQKKTKKDLALNVQAPREGPDHKHKHTADISQTASLPHRLGGLLRRRRDVIFYVGITLRSRYCRKRQITIRQMWTTDGHPVFYVT